MSKTILVIDDEIMLTDLLKNHLLHLGYAVFTANHADEAMALLPKQPDLILLDINMPDTDGLTFCKTIRTHVACPILFLTARVSEQDMVSGLQIGGDDYITKPFSLAELTVRIEAHLRRDDRAAQSRKAPALVTSQGLIVNLSERTVTYQGALIAFSKREFDLLAFLMSNAGRVFDKERIYEAIWGYDADGDSNVIKEHIRKIRGKLLTVTGQECIETVWGVGYRWQK